MHNTHHGKASTPAAVDFWHTANRAFSPAERAAFNRWRAELWSRSARAVEATHWLPDEARFTSTCEAARTVHDTVREIPELLR